MAAICATTLRHVHQHFSRWTIVSAVVVPRFIRAESDPSINHAWLAIPPLLVGVRWACYLCLRELRRTDERGSGWLGCRKPRH
jgi:hypothetical protein